MRGVSELVRAICGPRSSVSRTAPSNVAMLRLSAAPPIARRRLISVATASRVATSLVATTRVEVTEQGVSRTLVEPGVRAKPRCGFDMGNSGFSILVPGRMLGVPCASVRTGIGVSFTSGMEASRQKASVA